MQVRGEWVKSESGGLACAKVKEATAAADTLDNPVKKAGSRSE